MSENVSYSAVAIDGGAVRESLATRKIFLHDDAAWQSTEERAEALRKGLKQELDSMSRKAVLSSKSTNHCLLEAHRLDSMMAAFSRVPAFKAFAEQAHAEEFARLRVEAAAFSSQSEKAESNNVLMQSVLAGQERLKTLATTVQKELCLVEKEVLLGAVASTLSGLGYLVETNGDALKATCNQTGFWAKAGDRGELAVDLSGHSGLSCMNEMVRIEEGLRSRGVRLRKNSSTPHGRPEGGSLVTTLRPLFPEFRKIESKHGAFKRANNAEQRKERCRS